MTAQWTAPRTWVVEELVTADMLNEQIRDNLEYLHGRPMAEAVLNEGADYSTSSTSFVPVDTTDLSLVVTTTSGAVLVGFHGVCSPANDQSAHFNIAINGVSVAGDDGIIAVRRTSTQSSVTFSFVRLVTGVATGTARTFRLTWKVSGGSATLYAGAGTTNWDQHPQFWVLEV